MTRFEGGFNSKYNSFGVESDAPKAKPEQAPAAEGGAFSDFEETELIELRANILGQLGWLPRDLEHDAIPFLDPKVREMMHDYAKAKTSELKKEIMDGFQKALDDWFEAGAPELKKAA